MTLFSATPASFFHASDMLALWPSTPTATTEASLFPGATAVALVIAGCAAGLLRWRRPSLRRSPFVFYAAAVAIMWAFAFGPAPPDSPDRWLHPYTLLAWLPGFNSLRVPARFAMLGTLCLAIAAGLAVARVLPERRPLRTLVAALAIAGLAADGWMVSMPLAAPPGRVILPDVPDAVVLELPANGGVTDRAAMYRSMQHGRPIVNGYSGHTPQHYVILSRALRRQDPGVLTELARGRPLVISVNPSFDYGNHLLSLVEGIPGIQPRGSSSGGALFVLPAKPAARVAPVGDPWPVTFRAAPKDYLDIDLGTPRIVRTIGFALRWRHETFDRRMAIEGSLDGQTWWTIWDDWTGAPAFVAAVEQPLEVPVRITVPDVSARYVRVHPAARWLQREIKVSWTAAQSRWSWSLVSVFGLSSSRHRYAASACIIKYWLRFPPGVQQSSIDRLTRPYMKPLISSIAAVVLLIVFAALPLSAQQHRAAIRGVVLDPALSPVENVEVRVTSEQTSEVRRTKTDQRGRFSVPELPSGSYRIDVHQSGFGPFVGRVELTMNQEFWLQVPLQVGDVLQAVDVTAPFMPVDRYSPALHTFIDDRQITGLPLDGRNFLELALLAPGTAPAPQGSASSVRGDFGLQHERRPRGLQQLPPRRRLQRRSEAEHAGGAAAGRRHPRVRGARRRPTTRRSGGTPADRSTC